MVKDNVEMICNVAELGGLFEQSASLEDFLQTVVSTVAYHMRAAVCSIYLYDEHRQELVMRATQGLSQDSIGRVRLQLGEGLVGVAVKELRPIREGSGFGSPHFKFIPNIREEQYQAFLVVPILRGLSRLGALVVQDSQDDYFTENDQRALQAIAAQLATTLDNARLLMSVHELSETEPAAPAETEETGEQFWRGVAISSGVAHGTAEAFGQQAVGFPEEPIQNDRTFTEDDFQHALERTEKQLETLQNEMEERLADVASLIFSAHLLILKDEEFSGEMQRLIRRGMAPPKAIQRIVREYINLFSSSNNPKLSEKVQDVKDLGRRLSQNLVKGEEEDRPVDYSQTVIVAQELLPSDLLRLVAQHAAGVVLTRGVEHSHIAILGRSLELPMMILRDESLLHRLHNQEVLLDGDAGTLMMNPGEEVLDRYASLQSAKKAIDLTESQLLRGPVTADGAEIALHANINLLSELDLAQRVGAGGIGLYRSEFPFIVRNDFPSEEEQYRIYSTIIRRMEGKEINFRTLDIGGDKMLSYFPTANQTNPFLGLRAIRFSLRYRDVFNTQLRALLRSGHETDLRIMFPLISSVDDFLRAREIVEECIGELQKEEIPHNPSPQLGVMMELPSAVEMAPELAREADFFCIGSNDLIQYILAVDRSDQEVSDLYLPHHPSVLRSLRRISEAAFAEGIDVSVCGDIAADLRLLPFLLGLGITKLSMAPAQIPEVQNAMAAISLEEARQESRELLDLSRIEEVEDRLREPTQP